jgi:hypothetical protein
MVPPTAVRGGRTDQPTFRSGVLRGPRTIVAGVSRPTRFEHNQYVGDKRSRVVHDLDAATDACGIDDLMASEQFAAFGPDSLAEARNRGYRPHPACTAAAG